MQQDGPLVDPLGASVAHNPLTADPMSDAYSKRASVADDPLSIDLMSDAFSRSFRRLTSKGSLEKQAEAAAADWDAYKTSMIQRFTTSDTIKVSATFDIVSRDLKGRGRTLTAAHLDELDNPEKEASEEGKIISQQEYVTRLRGLNDEIAQAWLNNERVAALRLSVKVAKLLSDTSVPGFYPTLFVLVTDVMETMGKLVWKRIKRKAEFDENGDLVKLLPEDFTAEDVRQEAKDTCKNWFFKIGSIRELLPRIYLEIAILRCTHFLERDPPKSEFERLTMMIRGLADPLAAAYARLYLARKGQSIIPSETGFLMTGLNDYILLFQRVMSWEFDKSIVKSGIEKQSYIGLVEPVFEVILQYIFKPANTEEMLFLMRKLGQHNSSSDNREASRPFSVVIHYLLKHLPAALVATQALELTRYIKSSEDISKSQYLNYKLLGTKLCECNPPRELRLAILNDVWKVVLKFSKLMEYLVVADVFIEYIFQCCSEVELNVLLRDIAKHLTKSDLTNEATMVLESIVFKIITHVPDLTHLLTMPYFVNILDVFDGDARNSVYKKILRHVSRDNQTICDPVTRHFIFELSKSLHNSLDSLSSEDDQRQIARLISRFVQLVDFGRDLEQHLSFLVDCRGTFSNMDLLRETVVHLSNRLAVMTLRILRGTSTQRSKDFVKSCVTFNEITIPSMKSGIKRMHLYLETAEVAMMNALVSHAESLVKSSIACLQEIDKTEDAKNPGLENEILTLIQKLCSFLIVIPGHPEQGTFYLLRSLIHVLSTELWLKGVWEVQAFCGILLACSALAQESLPYHINSMEIVSNDELFTGELSYHEELIGITSGVLDKIFAVINEAGNLGSKALDTCQVCLTAFEMGDKDMIQYFTSLIGSVKFPTPKDSKYLNFIMTFAQKRGLILPEIEPEAICT